MNVRNVEEVSPVPNPNRFKKRNTDDYDRLFSAKLSQLAKCFVGLKYMFNHMIYENDVWTCDNRRWIDPIADLEQSKTKHLSAQVDVRSIEVETHHIPTRIAEWDQVPASSATPLHDLPGADIEAFCVTQQSRTRVWRRSLSSQNRLCGLTGKIQRPVIR
jgi:hypothetical protein